MKVCIILFIISITITFISLYLVKNSHFYQDEEPVKLPLALWILLILITLLPVINIISCILGIIYLASLYEDRDLEFDKDFWLMKRY